MKKKDQAQTFSITRKPIKVGDEDVRMSPDPSIFSYEMTAVAHALFKEGGSMRTSQKSQLAKHIVWKDSNITHTPYDNSAGRVHDGCALIPKL